MLPRGSAAMLLIVALCSSWLLHTSRRWRGARSVTLLGEEDVSDPASARQFASTMVREAEALSPLLLVRASAKVHVPGGGGGEARGRAADALFALLTSPRGYALIDPLSDPQAHAAPLARVDGWRGRLEVARATTPAFPWLLAQHEFVVLNAVDPTK
ncbi:hypothetical protein T492DRAFT_1116699 [Pavlovales sp. CCMP2436]|nr:hypothetical protein T492DRAFT_1116699 [Pavlovales sp. CCMP2436]